MQRDLPPNAEPAIRFEELSADSGPTPFFFGGLPHLPPYLEWPRSEHGEPLHFVAQLELGSLPRDAEQAGQTFPIPRFPARGTLFVFMPLASDEMYGGRCAVLFSPDQAGNLPKRQPPDDLPVLIHRHGPDEEAGFHDSLTTDPELVSECGRLLPRRYAVTNTFLSHRAENPLIRNMERADRSKQELYARDLAHTEQLTALGFPHVKPMLPPSEESKGEADHLPPTMREWFEKELFNLEWEYVHEWAQRMWMKCYQQLVIYLTLEIELMEQANRHGVSFENVLSEKEIAIRKRDIAYVSRWVDAIEPFSMNSSRTWARIVAFSFRATEIFDARLRFWMERATLRRGNPMSDDEKSAFVNFLSRIDSWKEDETHVTLLWTKCGPKRKKVRSICHSVFRDIAEDMHNYTGNKEEMNFGDHDARITQTFGLGYLLQQAAVQNEDKVLLLQIGNFGGLDFARIDGLCQLWITHDALAAADFSDVLMTMETT